MSLRSAVISVVIGLLPLGAAAEIGSAELRLEPMAQAVRFSATDPTTIFDDGNNLKGSNYLRYGVGVRVFPNGGSSGLLLDAAFHDDLDWDSIFDESGGSRVDITLIHAGYAHRFLYPSTRHPNRTLAVTPHASLGAGAAHGAVALGEALSEGSSRSWPDWARLPVMSVRVGVDVDIHFRRGFMGWTLQYTYVHHFSGTLEGSHIVTANLIPICRFGFDFGKPADDWTRDGPE